jgi:hypothetical protein
LKDYDMGHYIIFIVAVFLSQIAFSQIGKRVGKVEYYHATVGTAAQDTLPAINVDARNVKGWRICHDSDSTANYLAISIGADPAADGVRIGAGLCFDCDDCGGVALKDSNVKADAAATGYSVIQFK